MSILMSAFSVSNNVRASALVSSVFPTPVGPKNRNDPMGLFGSLSPARDFLMAFETEKALIRIDMSEYMEKHSVARLIGAPPGYVGYDQGGQLTEAVRRRPYSVVLLDEVEKAHSEVFNVLLQLLDDGRLTDGQGRTVDFKNTVIIMTSNLGSDSIVNGFRDGDSYESIVKSVQRNLESFFRPEFLNRIDRTIVFEPLNETYMEDITRIQLQQVTQRLRDRDIRIIFEDDAIAHLAKQGYDPLFGARPLKRIISNTVEDALADMILNGTLQPNSEVRVSVSNDALDFQTT
jgi:ATP-dependent Clp protease ATP-binding subunit ClpB